VLHGNKFALEFSNTSEHARYIGLIISQFAVIEGHPQKLISKMGIMPLNVAETVLSVFRAFSNKIGIIDELRKTFPVGLKERQVLSYYKGLFTEANKIRNYYAHAKYKFHNTGIVIQPFASDLNSARPDEKKTVDEIKADSKRLKRIFVELEHFYRAGIISDSLQK